MKYMLLFLLFFLLVPLINVESTFFDQDDAFIMGGSITGGVIGGATNGGGCRYEWNCTNWSECLSSGKQTRNCINTGYCSDRYKTPEVEQNCVYTAPKPKKEDKELENEIVPPDKEETKKQHETGENIVEEEMISNNRIELYSIIILILVFIILYLKKDYLKKLIKK